jgi:hypothetical protein
MDRIYVMEGISIYELENHPQSRKLQGVHPPEDEKVRWRLQTGGKAQAAGRAISFARRTRLRMR